MAAENLFLCVSVVLELGDRRLLHVKATAHPTAAWTLHPFQEILAEQHGYHYDACAG